MKLKYLHITILLLLFTVAYRLNGQQFPVYSQYWTNKFLLNPAVAGHEGYTSFNLTARKQWTNLQGSPATISVSGQTRIVKNSHISRKRSIFHRRRRMSKGGKVGCGGYIFSDNLGVINRTGLQGTYSYNIAMRRSALSFGLSIGGMQYNLNKDEMRYLDPDQLIDNTDNRNYFIDGNFGVYYSTKNLYAGFSVQNLSESYIRFNKFDDASKLKLERQYLLMSGYRYDIVDFVYLEPSFVFKFSENIVSQIDINLSAYFHENYWCGLAYRSGSSSKITTESLGGRGTSIILYGGARIDKFFVGYSFDYIHSSIQAKTYGSHEIMMAMRFGDNARRYRWLNRY